MLYSPGNGEYTTGMVLHCVSKSYHLWTLCNFVKS